MQTTLAVVDDPLFDEHSLANAGASAGELHPERPERLLAARKGLAAVSRHAKCLLKPRDASREELQRVHSGGYLDALSAARGGSGYLDPDTYYAPQSVDAATRAAGGAVALVDALMDGNADYGVALLRPPGHHARPGAAMGFCLLNHIAIAAAHARARGAERVLIVDWDVHHGNGTQEIFYDDPSVLFASLHQAPFYPGTGAAAETGASEGTGYTVNIPLSAGAGRAAYLAATEQILCPVVAEYDPDLLLVSAGFDAHARDPLAGMKLEGASYAALVHALEHAMPRGARGRLGLLLEGGYDLQGLEESLAASLDALGAEPQPKPRPLEQSLSSKHQRELQAARAEATNYWRI